MSSYAPKTVVLRRAAAAALCCAAAVYLAAVRLAGGSILRFALYAAVFCCMLLPGMRLAELLVPEMRGAAKASLSLGLGAALLFLSYISFGRLAPAAIAVPLAPLAIWQAFVLVRRARRGKRPAVFSHPAVPLLALAYAGGLFVYAFAGVLAFARAGAAGNMEYHQDMLWSAGNAAAVQLGAPLPDIRAVGSLLYYHYLGDALPGFAALFSGVSPYEAVCFYTYPLILFFLCLGLYAAARAYGAQQRAAALLPFCVLFLNGWRSDMTLNVLRNMNGVATATALTAAVLLLFFQTPRGGVRSVCFYAAYSLAMLTLLMAKNLYGILLFCAAFASVLFGLIFQRRLHRHGLILGSLGAAVFGLCWFFVYRNAVNNLVLTLWQTPGRLAQAVLLSLPLGSLMWLASVAHSFVHRRELPFSRLTVNAAVLGGLLAYFIFHHYSASQQYFLLAAFLFMWFCALDTLSFLHTPASGGMPRAALRRAGRWTAGALACLSLVCTALTLAPVGRKGVQVALRCTGLRPQYPYTVQTAAPGDEQAALWLRAHMRPDEVFAVNRNAKDPAAGDGIWHYYTAVSGRQAYVESWRYSMDYGHDYAELRRQLEQVNDVLFAAPDAKTAFEMARATGVRYLLVSKPCRPVPFQGAFPVYENEAAAIYDVFADA